MVNFLTGLESDLQEIVIKDMDESICLVLSVLKWCSQQGVGYVDGSDIVLYTA